MESFQKGDIPHQLYFRFLKRSFGKKDDINRSFNLGRLTGKRVLV